MTDKNVPASQLALQWIENPLGETPPNNVYCKTRDIFTARLDELRVRLNHCSAGNSLLIALCGEIGNNSFDHNMEGWRDIPGIIFSPNFEKKIIVLADRGQGIYKTLLRVKPDIKDDLGALKVAFTEVISGRSPEKRGNGLKFVQTTATDYKISIIFQSGNAVCEINNGNMKFINAQNSVKGCLAIIDYGGMISA